MVARRRGLLLATVVLLMGSWACAERGSEQAGSTDAGTSAGAAAAVSRSGGTGAEADVATPRPDGDGVAFDDRLQRLQAAVDRAPDDPATQRELARALHAVNRAREAVPYFERVAELAPGPESTLELALAYAAVSRGDQAEAAYRRLLEQVPNHPVALHNLGNLDMKRGRTANAAQWYAAAVKVKPDYLLAWFHLGEALNQAGRHREAYRAYETALGLEPTSSDELAVYDDALYRLASLDMMMGATERAEAMLVALLEANPEHHAANYAYAQLMLAQGRHDDAERALQRHQQVMQSSPTLQAMSDPALDLRDSK